MQKEDNLCSQKVGCVLLVYLILDEKNVSLLQSLSVEDPLKKIIFYLLSVVYIEPLQGTVQLYG
jgi:hypothetical protein